MTYEFDTWPAYKEFMAENRKNLKTDDEIIVRDGETTITFKVVTPYSKERDLGGVLEYTDENGNRWVSVSASLLKTDTQKWVGIFDKKPVPVEEIKKTLKRAVELIEKGWESEEIVN